MTRLLAFLIVFGLLALPSSQAGKVLNDALVTRPFGHHVFQEVLTRHVTTDGVVHLVKLRADPHRLNQYLDQLAAVSPDSHPDYFLDRHEQLAYWINAHNAMALRQLLDVYPVEALPPGLENQPFYRLGGVPMSLAMLRHKIAAEFATHPQAWFALSDMTMDAPHLASQVYRGDRLPLQLLQQRENTIASGHLVRFVPGACMGLELSPYLLGLEAALLEGAVLDEAARLDQPLPPEEAPVVSGVAVSPSRWVDLLRPFAPPEAYAELGRACAHGVTFRPPDRRLREVR